MRLADAAQISEIIQADRMRVFRADMLQGRKQQIIHRADLLFAVRHAAQNLIDVQRNAVLIADIGLRFGNNAQKHLLEPQKVLAQIHHAILID